MNPLPKMKTRGSDRVSLISNATVTLCGPALEQQFVYDGWIPVVIVNPQSSILQAFIWGLDLSGSLQGTGGVGGLLEVVYYGTQTTNCFTAYDGNGNITALVNAANGEVVYQWYLHSPDTSDPHFREEVYIRNIRSSLGNTFGGLKEVGRRNCRGNPVEVQAYMRTRLVSPGWQFAIWRSTFGTPDPSTMLGIYQENTQVHYTCDDCCGRGQSKGAAHE